MAENVQKLPPLLPDARRSSRTKGPAIFFACVIGAMLIARISEHVHVPFLKCMFKATTNLPCATCGGTRALRALSRGEISEAFLLNPMVFLGAVGGLIAVAFWLAFPDLAHRWKARLARGPWIKFAIAAALLNWTYLIFYGRV